MMNLVVNARDAMPSGGEIGIKTNNRVLDMPLIRDRVTVPAGEYVCVRVIDEGCGIPADRLDKIFEPFWTTKRPGEGTGLGLSTVYGIVKQTGGYIFAHSEVGVGTEFELLFPSHSLPVADKSLIPPPQHATVVRQVMALCCWWKTRPRCVPLHPAPCVCADIPCWKRIVPKAR
jgi:two-component system cell cycle sensor histidine kinase/response regulator CckA